MWQRLNLRARILIGYGIVLVLASALAAFLIAQVGDLNQKIASINASSAADAKAGAYLAANVADAQQAVDRWLQDPRDVTKADAMATLDRVANEIQRTEPLLVSAGARSHLRTLATSFSAYRKTITEMSTLLDEQQDVRARLRTAIFQSASLANIYAGDLFFRNEGTKASVLQLFDAQESLQLAMILVDRLAIEQTPDLSEKAQRELRNAQFNLQKHLDMAPSEKLLQTATMEVTASITATQLLQGNQEAVRKLRFTALLPQERLVGDSADAIAANALQSLTDATEDLQQQVARTQQLAGAAMLAMIVAAVLAGLQLAAGLTRPLVELAGAVARVNRGDYAASVPHTQGGEIGQLAAAFNQMTATLAQQRDEVRAQQDATAARNLELEHALADLQAATDAREQLAASVRSMSVPVVPILRQVIVVPLVGEVDERRAEVLIQRLLAGVSEEQARIVILDITGVPFVDATLATLLLQAAAAVELLGARCVLVGISPEVAQALVMSGSDLSRLATYADLRGGVEFALRATARQRR